MRPAIKSKMGGTPVKAPVEIVRPGASQAAKILIFLLLLATGPVFAQDTRIYSGGNVTRVLNPSTAGTHTDQFQNPTYQLDAGHVFKIRLYENAPGAATAALTGAGAGNVDNGAHSYKITFVTAGGETEAGTASAPVTVADKTVNGQVALSAIPTGTVGIVTSRKIYRTVAGDTGDYKLVATIANNTATTYTDNTADSSLGAIAPSANTAVDTRLTIPNTGIPTFVSGNYLPLAGGTMTGPITLSGTQLGTYTLGGTPTIQPTAGTGFSINLSTTGDFAVNTNQFYVDTSASAIGIGTATPNINGFDRAVTLRSGTSGNLLQALEIAGTATVFSNTVGIIRFLGNAGATNLASIDAIHDGAANSGLLSLQVWDAGVNREVMRLKANGNVGIGMSPGKLLDVNGTTRAVTYETATNCSSSASPAVCAASPAGSVVVAAAATTVVVNTTAITANSQIVLTEDSSLGTKLSVTCNTTTGRTYTVSARTAATSFTITSSAAPTTNPACLSYLVVN